MVIDEVEGWRGSVGSVTSTGGRQAVVKIGGGRVVQKR
jgi:hypothetical protein